MFSSIFYSSFSHSFSLFLAHSLSLSLPINLSISSMNYIWCKHTPMHASFPFLFNHIFLYFMLLPFPFTSFTLLFFRYDVPLSYFRYFLLSQFPFTFSYSISRYCNNAKNLLSVFRVIPKQRRTPIWWFHCYLFVEDILIHTIHYHCWTEHERVLKSINECIVWMWQHQCFSSFYKVLITPWCPI